MTNSFATSQKWTGHFRALNKFVNIEQIFDKTCSVCQALTKGQDKLVNHWSKHQGLQASPGSHFPDLRDLTIGYREAA